MLTIDLNCDMGESFGLWKLGQDEEVIPHITSANVACGGHAGDLRTMEACARLAKSLGVRLGAHPGPWNRGDFGRGRMQLGEACRVAGPGSGELRRGAREQPEQVHRRGSRAASCGRASGRRR